MVVIHIYMKNINFNKEEKKILNPENSDLSNKKIIDKQNNFKSNQKF